jgi:predicted HAD superfamily hydrolase
LRPLISLDVFDTAIFRKVLNPTDIFNIVEEQVGHDFKTIRMAAQDRMRRKDIYYNLIDIYKESAFPFNPKEEIKAEYNNCKANPYVLNMYNNTDADFIFISDMYLPATVIKSMLEKCGYKNPQVYVSCEYRALKGDGKLFIKVEKALNRRISKHVGDNYYADIVGAKKAGIPEVEFIGPPVYNKEIVTPPLQNVKLRKLLIDNELREASIEEKIGYMFAPLILAFTQSVLDEATDKQTIYFNARDSFLMYIVARWILKTKKKIKYCRFSRKSCLLSDVITHLSITHQLNSPSLHFFKIQRAKSLRDFLKLYNISEDRDFSDIYREFGIDLDTDIEFHNRRPLIIERLLIKCQEEFYSKVRVERKNFLAYLKRIGIKNNDIFVDLGYAGTIQGIIKRISGIDLKGRYINTYDSTGKYMGHIFEKKSFLPVGLMRSYGGAVIEVIFTEGIGTVVGYEADGKPILLQDFKFRKDISRRIFKGALKGVKDLISEGINKISAHDCTVILKRYLDKPTIEEALFGSKKIFENGTNGTESITWYDHEFIKEGKLRECYNKSYWKAAFKLLLSNDPQYKFLTKVIG